MTSFDHGSCDEKHEGLFRLLVGDAPLHVCLTEELFRLPNNMTQKHRQWAKKARNKWAANDSEGGW